MTYSFTSLSPADFEDLARDLLGEELACRFEGFGPGPDGGVDGRHAKSGATTILQAKHLRMSGFAALARQMRSARPSINQIQPDKYILVTSVSLTPANKKVLADSIGPSLNNASDILGFEDLNSLLRKHDNVAKSHVKLWLSDTAILERVLQSGSHNFNAVTRAEITAKLNVYAENPSFGQGRKVLESQRILIISGLGGVGKTTLAEMLAYAYIGEDWDLVAIRSLDDGFARINDSRRQVFFFDDFLGRIALDERALSTQDTELGRFIARVRRTPTARFILTTRAPVFQHAKLVSDVLADQRLDVAQYLLDVSIYTRRIRARILYNHLVVAGVPIEHIRALYDTETIKKIIDHKCYNPRIVEWMTDASHIEDVAAEDYPEIFINKLNDPESIWDKQFQNHIPRRCQHLLFSLYFGSQYGAEIEDIQEIFEGLHPILCQKFGIAWNAKDFESSVKVLEGGFIAVANGRISFINPSVRDYLYRYLLDKKLLVTMAAGAPTPSCAMRIVDQFKKLPDLTPDDWRIFLAGFTTLVQRLDTIPRWKRISSNPINFRVYDTTTSDRINMLLLWWKLSGRELFLEKAVAIATDPKDQFKSWDDARTLPTILANLLSAPQNEKKDTGPLVVAIENAIRKMLGGSLDPDDLERVVTSIDTNKANLGHMFDDEINTAIPKMIENISDNLGHVDSDSTLSDYISTVEKLANRIGYNRRAVESAKRAIQSRIEEVNENAAQDEELSVTGEDVQEDTFDDQDLKNLFEPLLAEED
ncbi:ATP-binding protein [Gluconobacter cerinus]|uniref:nSTAND3 domain-containing NTPase n=1 Tax=Gluconobacter cerinus TaxID=38307 RepID=UPI001B8D772D|nr:ATP-binding protein [Gluconobacter cerinus]MBS1020099.1 ATP-binding protein [Gluconobacter cerinus]